VGAIVSWLLKIYEKGKISLANGGILSIISTMDKWIKNNPSQYSITTCAALAPALLLLP